MIFADGHAIWIDPWDDDERNICEVAGELSSEIMEGAREFWPACPLHPGDHPLVPYEGGWRCGTRLIAGFGHLGEDGGPRQT